MASRIPCSTRSFQSYLHGNFFNSLFLYPSTEHENLEICSSFRSGTAAGLDNVTMNVIKETASLICSPLVDIFNLSLSSGSVPDQMKCARVIPLFKSGLTSLFTNYRPVSVLPAFSKILETLKAGTHEGACSRSTLLQHASGAKLPRLHQRFLAKKYVAQQNFCSRVLLPHIKLV